MDYQEHLGLKPMWDTSWNKISGQLAARTENVGMKEEGGRAAVICIYKPRCFSDLQNTVLYSHGA